MSHRINDGPTSHWWPCGEFTEALSDAVLEANWVEAKRLSREFKQLCAKRQDYEVLVKKLCEQVTACHWDKADQTLELMEFFPDMVKCDLTYYQTVVSFDRDCTVLDRIVEATAGE